MKPRPIEYHPDWDVPCPACLGEGKSEAKVFCWNCWGFGWVESGSLDATCVPHGPWIATSRPLPAFCHEAKCEKCGCLRSWDSSG